MYTSLYTLLFIILSPLVVCETAMEDKEKYTNCSQWIDCLKNYNIREQLIIEYMTAVHDKDKYNNLCKYRGRVSECNDWYLYGSCYFDEMQARWSYSYYERERVCYYYGQQWKDAENNITKDDFGCEQFVGCFKNVIDKYNIDIGISSAILKGDNQYKAFCSYSKEFKKCWQKNTAICEMKIMNDWLRKLYDDYNLYCVEKKTLVSELTLETLTTERCQRDKCWNDLLNINLTDLENFYFTTDVLKKQELCQKRNKFRECDDPYAYICGGADSTGRMKKIERLLNETFCSEEDKKANDIYSNDVVSNCSGFAECLKAIADRDRRVLNSLAQVYDKTIYNKICSNTDLLIYSCFNDLVKTCPDRGLIVWMEHSQQGLEYLCKRIDYFWGVKVTKPFLDKDDIQNCSEPFKCLKKLADEENIAVGYADFLINETRSKKLCLNSSEVKACLNYNDMPICKSQVGVEILENWEHILHTYCGEEKFPQRGDIDNWAYFEDVNYMWRIINSSVCPIDECWNALNKIDRAALENFDLFGNQSMKEKLCKQKEGFKICRPEYPLCTSYGTNDQFIKRKLLDYLYCPNKDTEELDCCQLRKCFSNFSKMADIFSGDYQSLQNEQVYNEMCPIQNNTYDCYFESISDCHDTFDVYSFETLRLIHEFVCSDEGRQAIALLPRSKCSKNHLEFKKAIQEYFDCPLISKSPVNNKCPYTLYVMLEKCLRAAFEKRCGSEFTSFHWKLWQIKHRNKKCDEEPRDLRFLGGFRY